MKYIIEDINEEQFELNGDSSPSIIRGALSRDSDSYSFDQQIVDRTFLSGSVVVGNKRLQSRKFKLTSPFVFETDIAYDDYINILIYQLEKSVRLIDVTNSKYTSITFNSLSVSFDKGAVKRAGEFNILVTILDGLWYRQTDTEVTDTLISGTNTIPLVNSGVVKAYPLIKITVTGECNQIDVYINETKEGLQFKDPSFGSPGLIECIIDCYNGTLTVASYNRSQYIVEGTGYFPIPVGNSDLKVEIPVDGAIDISYRLGVFV